MSNNVLITVVLPDERVSGQPLPVERVGRVDILMSTGSTFGLVGSIIAPETTLNVNDLPNGLVVFRGTVYDLDGRPSTDLDVSYDNSGPNPLKSLVIELVA